MEALSICSIAITNEPIRYTSTILCPCLFRFNFYLKIKAIVYTQLGINILRDISLITCYDLVVVVDEL